jgi:hypothetical protein
MTLQRPAGDLPGILLYIPRVAFDLPIPSPTPMEAIWTLGCSYDLTPWQLINKGSENLSRTSR